MLLNKSSLNFIIVELILSHACEVCSFPVVELRNGSKILTVIFILERYQVIFNFQLDQRKCIIDCILSGSSVFQCYCLYSAGCKRRKAGGKLAVFTSQLRKKNITEKFRKFLFVSKILLNFHIMVRCKVSMCFTGEPKKGGGKFITFKFPDDSAARTAWIKALKIDPRWVPTKHDRICELHFTEVRYLIFHVYSINVQSLGKSLVIFKCCLTIEKKKTI